MTPSRRAITSLFALSIILSACAGEDENAPAPSSAGSVASVKPSPSESHANSSPSSSPTVFAIVSAAPEASEALLPDAASWTLAARFGEDSTLTSVTDVAAWNGGFVAIGDHWAGDAMGGPYEPRIWTSRDGRDWNEAAVDLGTDGVQLVGIALLASNDLLIMGDLRRVAVGAGERPPHLSAWTSTDGTTWSVMDIPFGETLTEVAGFDAGPRGIVASTGSEIWFSTNARDWSRVHAADGRTYFGSPAAGDEGFVVPAVDVDAGERYLLASGDGTSWFESERAPFFGPPMPYGPDWMSWRYADDPPSISLLRSANGLNWEPILDVNTLTPEDGPKAGRAFADKGINEAWLSSVDGLAVLTLGWNHCCAVHPVGVGVWTSADALTWEPAGLETGAYVTAAASDGDVVVLAGRLQRGQEAAFWVAER